MQQSGQIEFFFVNTQDAQIYTFKYSQIHWVKIIWKKIISVNSDRIYPKYVRKTDHNCHPYWTGIPYQSTRDNAPRLVERSNQISHQSDTYMPNAWPSRSSTAGRIPHMTISVTFPDISGQDSSKQHYPPCTWENITLCICYTLSDHEFLAWFLHV